MIIEFRIDGNQENPNGHAIPYERSTRAGQWNPRVKRYNAWKDYIRLCYKQDVGKDYFRLYKPKNIKQANTGKMIFHDKKCRMDVHIVFGSKAHADADNIWKAIADALFYNDKAVVGSFDYTITHAETPHVRVKLTF